jgi:hypothetical protein
MRGMRSYIVRRDDYLERIARALGCAAAAIWNDPANAALKALRQDPDLLHPGDVLQVPEPAPPPRRALAIGATNRYVAPVEPVRVRIAFRHEDAPLAHERYRIDGLDHAREGVTNDGGELAFDASVDTREVLVAFPDRGVAYRAIVARLDPVEEPSGLRARLANLGFLRWNGDEDEVRVALTAFQRAQGLEPTGTPDSATRAALVAEHGR